MQKLTKEQKELQGTYEPSKEGFEPVQYDEYERCPTVPEGLPFEAQGIWRDRCNDLKKAGHLKKANMDALRVYCFAHYTIQRCQKLIDELSEEEFLTTKAQKLYNRMNEASKVALNYGAKFGFSPLDSAKIPKIMKEEKTMTLLK
jgi:phage terminase small subunit